VNRRKTPLPSIRQALSEFSLCGLQKCFEPAVKKVLSQGPTTAFVIGSGAAPAYRDGLSDADALFLWQDHRLFGALCIILDKLREEKKFTTSYFGPHIQFGHLVCVRSVRDYAKSFDIGLMSHGFYRDFLPPTRKRLVYGVPPSGQQAPPQRRIFLLLHTLGQCIKSCHRSRFVFAADYLCRARTTLLLMRCQKDDADGMRRSTFQTKAEAQLLAAMPDFEMNRESILSATRSILSAAESEQPEAKDLITSFRSSFGRYGL